MPFVGFGVVDMLRVRWPPGVEGDNDCDCIGDEIQVCAELRLCFCCTSSALWLQISWFRRAGALESLSGDSFLPTTFFTPLILGDLQLFICTRFDNFTASALDERRTMMMTCVFIIIACPNRGNANKQHA